MLRRWIEEGADWPESAKLAPKKKSFTTLGMLPKDLYKELGFMAGKSQDEFVSYRQDIETSNLNFEMLPITGGEFLMGSPATDEKRGDNELLSHKVKVSDFWMGKYEVTWDEYELWMINLDKDNREYNNKVSDKADTLSDAVTKPTAPYVDMSFGMGKDGYPAISMTQHAASKYCQWLSAKTGHFYRLPTEAEWEYCARSGTDTKWCFGNFDGDLDDYGWHAGNSGASTREVGLKKPNNWEVFDIYGLISEWCLDNYRNDYTTPSKQSPYTNNSDIYCVRGGSWFTESDSTRSSARSHAKQDKTSDGIGLRLVWEPL